MERNQNTAISEATHDEKIAYKRNYHSLKTRSNMVHVENYAVSLNPSHSHLDVKLILITWYKDYRSESYKLDENHA